MSAGTEQHLPYRSTADVVVLDGDGSRWVRERTCHLRHETPHSPWGVCSRCGAFVNTFNAVSNASMYIDTRHCPNCGAKVTEKGAER